MIHFNLLEKSHPGNYLRVLDSVLAKGFNEPYTKGFAMDFAGGGGVLPTSGFVPIGMKSQSSGNRNKKQPFDFR